MIAKKNIERTSNKNLKNSLEDKKDYLADMLRSEIISYPRKILVDLKKKMPYINVPQNEIFVCGKLLENWVLTISTNNDDIIFPSGLELETKHSFVKIKEGLGEFGGWQDFPGLDKQSLRIASNEAEFTGREIFTEFIGERGQVRGIKLKNDQFVFDTNLNNIVKSDYDIRNENIYDLAPELININATIKKKSKNRIKRVVSDISSSLEMSLMANSGGALVYQKIPRTYLKIFTYGYPQSIQEEKIFTLGCANGLDFFYDLIDGKIINYEEFLNDIVKESIDFFYNSKSIEKTGFRPYEGIKILMSPSVAGVFAHESLGHHVEQDLEDEERGARFLRDHIGETVSSANISISFDPSRKNKYNDFGFYFYDDEGTKAFQTHIIKDDVAIDTLTDLSRASLYNIKPNAHSRGDWIRMSNLTIHDNNGINPDELFNEIAGKGYYIKRAYSGFTNEAEKQARIFIDSLYFVNKDLTLTPIKTVSLPASKKRELAIIEYGLSVDSLDFLHNIQYVGKNEISLGNPIKFPFLSAGSCGKGGWFFGEDKPVSGGGAYLLLDNILLTKNEMDAPREGFIKAYNNKKQHKKS